MKDDEKQTVEKRGKAGDRRGNDRRNDERRKAPRRQKTGDRRKK